jgi:GT2 family glycosyltransferase
MVSIVILAYNRSPEVEITVTKVKSSLKQFPYPAEIIVVDNASIDNTSEMVKELFPEVVLVTKKINNGIAGWNDGFAKAQYDYMVVLDDDSHIEYGLNEAIDYLSKNKNIGVLALEVEGGPYETHAMPDKEQLAGFIGCGAIITKELYNKIGGFAEWLLVYGHEWEYGIRCIDAGYKLEFFKKCKVFHRVSTLNRSNSKTYTFSTRNELLLIYLYFKKNKEKYLHRLFINHLKWRVADAGISGLIATYKGWIEFKKMKRSMVPKPVKSQTQEFFIAHFHSLTPIWSFLTKRFK